MCNFWQCLVPVSRREFRKLQLKVYKTMTTQAELAGEVVAVQEQVAKIGTETQSLVAKVAELEAIIAAEGNASPELVAAVEGLKAQVQRVDELVVDVPAE